MVNDEKTIKVYLTPELDKELRGFLVDHDVPLNDRTVIVSEAIKQFIKTGGHDDKSIGEIVSVRRKERVLRSRIAYGSSK